VSEVHLTRAPDGSSLFEARLHFEEDVGFPELVGTGHDPTKACIDLLTKVGGLVEQEGTGSETRVSDPRQPPQNPPKPKEGKPLSDETQVFVDDLLRRQEAIDSGRKAMADEIIDSLPGDADLAQVAKNWVVTAAQECSNAGYWRERAWKAEALLTPGTPIDPPVVGEGIAPQPETKPEPVGEVQSDLAVSVPPPAPETTPGEVEAPPVPSDG
jgi:hypothetical protein